MLRRTRRSSNFKQINDRNPPKKIFDPQNEANLNSPLAQWHSV
jgi:hypothetical protein